MKEVPPYDENTAAGQQNRKMNMACPRLSDLVLAMGNRTLSSFEAGRSGRGDRVLGEAYIPLDAAELVPGSAETAAGATYRIEGDWELEGVVGPVGGGARVGADIIVRPPPSPLTAAGRLRKRESVGWYAR